MRVRRFASVGAVALACALLVAPLAALAQTPGNAALTTAIREISFDTKGNTNVVVSVTGTALYDAVAQGSTLLDRQLGVQRNIVIFSDGRDTTSKSTLAQAVNTIKTTNTATTAVLLSSSVADFSILQQLSGATKGGAALQVDNITALRDAFSRAAQGLTSQYILTYPASDTTIKDLNISVAATVGGFTASDSSV